jgi:outer membrane cobalamin receptor
MFKSLFFFAAILLAFLHAVSAQTGEMPVKQIPQVTIVENNKDYFSDDNPTYSLDHASHLNRQQNLGYLLERESQVLVRSYGGEGSLVSLSLHGTGSNHTQVSWNGFPLNSPTTGQADLSLIPASFMQTIEVINGASGALFGSGTFGGSINMGNEADWNNRLAMEYTIGAGSFGSFNNSLFLKAGNRKFQYHLSAVSGRAENNFSYHDYYKQGSPPSIATHNAYRSLGIIQNFYLNLGKGNYLEAGLWYQRKMKEMPRLMGYYQTGNAVQRDSLFRSYISYRKTTEKSMLMIKSGWFSDFLNFTDKISARDSAYSLNSEIAAGRLMNEADYRYYLSPSVVLGGGMSYYLSRGRSANYGGVITEHDYAVYANIKIRLNDLIINSGLRREFYDEINPPFQYSFGLRYKVSDKLVLRSAASSKFRKPTFNEKYWVPGGNPGLNPEKGWGGEVSAEWEILDKTDDGPRLKFLTNAYFQNIENWIQWVLRDSLTPVEYKNVHAWGLENRVNFEFPAGQLDLSGFVAYIYSRSVIKETYDHNPLYAGKQLMYIPAHSAKAGIMAEFRGITVGAGGSYTGSRETVETEDPFVRLDPYVLLDVMAGINHKLFGMSCTLYGHIDNILNSQYEVIRSYPMPGRSFHLALTVGLNRNNPE